MSKRVIRVISDPKIAKLLVDSAKRQILRHLAESQLTQRKLGDLLGMADPSVYYHLKELSAAGLVRVAHTKPERHGIIQKFYEATAIYFLADYTKMPLELRRYFIAVNMERLRGVLALLNALRNISINLSAEEMERLAEKIAVELVRVTKENPNAAAAGRESLIISLYGEALRRVIRADGPDIRPLNLRLTALDFLKL